MAMSGILLTDDSKIKYDEIYKGKKHRSVRCQKIYLYVD